MRRVAVLTAQEYGFGRDVLRGVNRYVRLARPWAFRYAGLQPEIVPILRAWKPDGIIAQLARRSLAADLLALNVPLVNVSSMYDFHDVPHVGIDDRAVGGIAAEHLISRGFRTLAFVGFGRHGYSVGREEGFIECATARGVGPVERFVESAAPGSDGWSKLDEALTAWLQQLPKPVGVFACNDARAYEVAHCCRAIGVSVPDEVAVVGVDNDAILCESISPPLSSVSVPGEQVGYEAASLLDGKLEGRGWRQMDIRVPAGTLVLRQSSDVLQLSDPDVAAAVRFIRDHARRSGLGVEEVLQEVPVNRRSLERAFKKALGRSIYQEILRVRLAHARQMLCESDASMQQIAERSGFESARRMGEAFRRTVGEPPATYRRRTRPY